MLQLHLSDKQLYCLLRYALYWRFDGNSLFFLHDRTRILPWIKSISNEVDIMIRMIESQLCGHCDIISNRLWHQQNVNHSPLEYIHYFISLNTVRQTCDVLILQENPVKLSLHFGLLLFRDLSFTIPLAWLSWATRNCLRAIGFLTVGGWAKVNLKIIQC